jgi:hypothetical protein
LVLVANETEPVQSLRRERRHCARRTPACADDTVRSVSASHTRTSKPTSRCRAPARASSCGVVRHVRDRSCSWSSYTRSTAVSHRLSRHECAPVPRLRTLDYRFAASFVPLNLKDGDKGKGRSHAQQCAAQSAVQPRTDCSAWVRMNSCGSSRPAAGRRSSCPHPVRLGVAPAAPTAPWATASPFTDPPLQPPRLPDLMEICLHRVCPRVLAVCCIYSPSPLPRPHPFLKVNPMDAVLAACSGVVLLLLPYFSLSTTQHTPFVGCIHRVLCRGWLL